MLEIIYPAIAITPEELTGKSLKRIYLYLNPAIIVTDQRSQAMAAPGFAGPTGDTGYRAEQLVAFSGTREGYEKRQWPTMAM